MAAVYTLEELAAQVVHLTWEIRTLQRQLADQSAAQPAPRDDAMESKNKGFLFEKKLFEPEKLERATSFKDWSEDLIDWVEQSDGHIAGLLRIARDSKGAITEMGGDEATITRSKILYRALKKLVVQPEAKAIATQVEGKNPYEAWRQLYGRFDPRNDATASSIILRLMGAKEWKCRVVSELLVTIAKLEALGRESRLARESRP